MNLNQKIMTAMSSRTPMTAADVAHVLIRDKTDDAPVMQLVSLVRYALNRMCTTRQVLKINEYQSPTYYRLIRD